MGKVEFGRRYRDPITGFEGTAVSRTEYMYGCARVALQAPMRADGSVPDWQTFDELQLLEAESDPQRGGPRPAPNARPDPAQR